jgi:hypothetical protein
VLTNLARQRILRTYDTYALKANKFSNGGLQVFLAIYDVEECVQRCQNVPKEKKRGPLQ